MRRNKTKHQNRIITLGFSPCPNDCFIFDALLHGKIDTGGLSFQPYIEDVEALNKRASSKRKSERLDVTKLSFYAFSELQRRYALLDAGSALGFGVGPLVVSDKPYSLEDLSGGKLNIAIPGKKTTANLLFSLAFPKAIKKKVMLFSDIEEAVRNGKADAGVIIHESRFTYQKKGLKKIIDLGEWWTGKTGAPIPLGCIAASKDLSPALRKKIDRAIRLSVEYAFRHPTSGKHFIQSNAQEMEEAVIRKHIRLYVNQYSVSLGTKGRKAIQLLLLQSKKKK